MARTSANLYRAIIDGTFTAVREEDEGRPVEGILYPRIEAETHFDTAGREWTRRAEMTVYCVEEDCVVQTDGGTVLFDMVGWFGYVGWRYFELPAGTVLPDSLTIRRSARISCSRTGVLQGRRHMIVPVARLTLQAYRAALDNLARNAIVRQIELAR